MYAQSIGLELERISGLFLGWFMFLVLHLDIFSFTGRKDGTFEELHRLFEKK